MRLFIGAGTLYIYIYIVVNFVQIAEQYIKFVCWKQYVADKYTCSNGVLRLEHFSETFYARQLTMDIHPIKFVHKAYIFITEPDSGECLSMSHMAGQGKDKSIIHRASCGGYYPYCYVQEDIQEHGRLILGETGGVKLGWFVRSKGMFALFTIPVPSSISITILIPAHNYIENPYYQFNFKFKFNFVATSRVQFFK